MLYLYLIFVIICYNFARKNLIERIFNEFFFYFSRLSNFSCKHQIYDIDTRIQSKEFFARSGFRTANGDIDESRLLQPVFRGAETETERQGGSVITSRFVEKTPRRRLSSIS